MAMLEKKMERPQNLYDTFFRVTMWARIVWGILRLIVGFGLLHLVGQQFSDIFYNLISHEIVEDPSDLMVRAVNLFIAHTSFTITYFAAFYLIFWGVIDIFLPINLLREKLWAFQVAWTLIGLFVLYEIYRFSYTHSMVLAGATVIDLLTLWLIRHEQSKLERRLTLQRR